MVDIEDVRRAQERIGSWIGRTALVSQNTFSRRTGQNVFLKLENFQRTGSFKLRGAFNKLLLLSPAEKEAGVIAASAGNHAQGVAFAATRLGIEAHVVMPKWAAASKVAATRGYGAHIYLEGETYDDAYNVAMQLAQAKNLTYVHAFDDPAIIAGQGTTGLEVLEDLPALDAVVVPVGGGGLISGIAVAIKHLRPNTQIIGVEATGASGMVLSRKKGMPVAVPSVHTIADGIAVKKPGGLTFDIVSKLVDDMVTVTDDEIALAILTSIERLKAVVEGAGAASIAAILSGKVKMPGKNVVAIVSGGNIDVDMISRIIERGLVSAGRRLRLRVALKDRPGALHQLLGIAADEHGNILGIEHDRTNIDVPIGMSEVTLTVAVHDHEHGQTLIDSLRKQGYEVQSL